MQGIDTGPGTAGQDALLAVAVTGPVDPQSVGKRGSEYAQLSRQIKQAGLLERRTSYYIWKTAVTAALLIAGWGIFVLIGNSWWQLATAAYLGVMFTQVGFLGHDAGHQQIFDSRRANYVLGILVGSLGIGFSWAWWVDKHNRHHAHPNTEGADPDIAVALLAFSEGQARAKGRAGRVIVRYQAYLLFPMLLMLAVSLQAASIRALISRDSRDRPLESALLAAHIVSYLAIVILVLSPVKAVVFIVMNQGFFGFYLGCSFAPNHKGMAVLAAGDQADFLHRQVLTSRNVRGGWLTDLALGGLNYQIEHHLFPSMSRPNLRRAQPLVAEFCRQRDVLYCQTTLLRSYAQALRHLRAVGRTEVSV